MQKPIPEKTDDLPADSLDVLFAGLEPLTPLLEEIRRCILAEVEISDDASAAPSSGSVPAQSSSKSTRD